MITDVPVSLLLGAPHTVVLTTFAATLAVVNFEEPTSTAEAVAFVDPVFSFDQQAFDQFAQQAGLPTFVLADYFRFEFSPLGPVEPPRAAGRAPVPSPRPGRSF